MIINDIKPSLESSSSFKESLFAIEDMGMIFDILRNKLYSNPIAAIAREISCNARDTHRAVGKFDVPIKIQLPNTLEPFFKIKDEGEGISPDRMENIFIRYTASTKRNDNIQGGGFGLGGKVCFSYSDSFVIVTVFDGIKYNYAAVIDETKVGKMALMSEESTSEPNGTEIIIPVKSQDFRNFRDATEFATRHWDVKPIVTGSDGFFYNELDKLVTGTNWAIVRVSDWNHEVKLIIDGIEYPCDLNSLKKYSSSSRIIDQVYGSIYLYFKVGELSLAANRESVYLDDATKQKIANAFDVVKDELKANVMIKVNQFDNLWDANVYYSEEVRKTFKDLGVLGTITWHGCELSNNHKSLDCQVFSFDKGKSSRRYGAQPDKISRHLGREIHFRGNSLLIINDLPTNDVGVRHVKSIFQDGIKYVEVIHPGDKAIDDLITAHHLDKMNVKYLSTMTDAKVRKHTSSSFRMTVFKFYSSKFNQTTYKDACAAPGTKVICRLSKEAYANARRIVLSGGKTLDTKSIEGLLEFDRTLSFFGIDASVDDARLKEDFEDFILIDKYIEENFINNKIDYVGIKYACQETYTVPSYSKINLDKVPDDSIFKINLKKIKEVKGLAKQNAMLYIYENFKGYITDTQIADWLNIHPDMDKNKMVEEIENNYPLLSCIDRYRYDSIEDNVIDYIKLIDATKGKVT